MILTLTSILAALALVHCCGWAAGALGSQPSAAPLAILAGTASGAAVFAAVTAYRAGAGPLVALAAGVVAALLGGWGVWRGSGP